MPDRMQRTPAAAATVIVSVVADPESTTMISHRRWSPRLERGEGRREHRGTVARAQHDGDIGDPKPAPSSESGTPERIR